MSRKEPASLINSTLRIFPQPDDGFMPDKVLVQPRYTFTNNNQFYVTASSPIGNKSSTNPMTRSREHFDKMRKAGWTTNWNQTYQKDHFVEVQHVVDILAGGPLGQGKWLSAPYEQYLHLSWYQNDRRNTWNIPASLNIRKGRILLSQYVNPELRNTTNQAIEDAQLDYLAEYLFCFSQNGTTPFLQLIDLCIDMAACGKNEVTELTNYVGKRVFDLLVSAYLRWSEVQKDFRYDRSTFEHYFGEIAGRRIAQDRESSVLEFTTAKLVDGQ